MAKLYLYNSLTRKKQEFKPIKKDQVGMYTCGPTVYNYAHLGNLRSYIFEDILKRVLLYNGYKVKHVMNVTDVGHLTGDRDMGEDKLELGAKREHKSAWEIADFYTEAFKKDIKALNISEPDIWCKATDYIKEQIELIKKLEKNDYAYKTSDGIYYDTAKFKDYNKLSHLPLEKLKEGARVEKNPEKKNPTDFTLWKFSPKNAKRQMEWDSPWGKGFPGWHIECSAMSLAILKDQLDIHCGGIDHINVHHTNEIAQSEAATGNKFFNFWLHGAFLNISGGVKMAKSEENFLTLENALINKRINPLAFRFAALQTHYRKPMEYSEEGIKNAESGLKNLYNQLGNLAGRDLDFVNSAVNENPVKFYKQQFLKYINNDLNLPKALSVIYEILKSGTSNKNKITTILDFDKVLGLEIQLNIINFPIPANIELLLKKRYNFRTKGNYLESDRLRAEIEKQGYAVEDIKGGQRIRKK